MNALSALIGLTDREKAEKGLAYTPAEISQQPDTWAKTYRIFLDSHSGVEQFLVGSGIDSDGRKPTVFLIGAGTSDYIGRCLAGLLRQKWQCEVTAVPSTDLLVNMSSYLLPGRSYLFISFSRSGDSSESVGVLQTAIDNYPEIRHLVITCNAQGQMVRKFRNHPGVFFLVLDDAVNDRGLAMTSSFSNMVVAGQCLANYKAPEAYGPVVSDLSCAGAAFLSNYADLAASIAREGFAKACFVGSGALAGVAAESALKVVELTAGRIHTMSESTLGLRHGPLSSLDDDSLFVSFLSSDPRARRYEMDLLEELNSKKLGKIRVAISPMRSTVLEALVDHALYLDTTPRVLDPYRPPVDVMFAQMVGLFSSLAKGLQPDRPSPNGAISRVVSHVNIYSN